MNKPFQTIEEVDDYISGDKIRCLICDKWYIRLTGHLIPKHKMEVREYKIAFNIPLRVPLWGQQCRRKASAKAKKLGLGKNIHLLIKGKRGRNAGSIIPELSTELSIKGHNCNNANKQIKKESVRNIAAACYKCGSEILRSKHGLRMLKSTKKSPLCRKCTLEYMRTYSKLRRT